MSERVKDGEEECERIVLFVDEIALSVCYNDEGRMSCERGLLSVKEKEELGRALGPLGASELRGVEELMRVYAGVRERRGWLPDGEGDRLAAEIMAFSCRRRGSNYCLALEWGGDRPRERVFCEEPAGSDEGGLVVCVEECKQCGFLKCFSWNPVFNERGELCGRVFDGDHASCVR